jgi:hypothetical protein
MSAVSKLSSFAVKINCPSDDRKYGSEGHPIAVFNTHRGNGGQASNLKATAISIASPTMSLHFSRKIHATHKMASLDHFQEDSRPLSILRTT